MNPSRPLLSLIKIVGVLNEVREASVDDHRDLYCTAGCHPTRSSEFEKYQSGPDGYLAALDDLISEDKKGARRIVAVGECGLGDIGFFLPMQSERSQIA